MSLALYLSRVRSSEVLGVIGTVVLKIWGRICFANPSSSLRIAVGAPPRLQSGDCDKGTVDLQGAAHATDSALTRFVRLATQKLPITIVVV
jgi:hypothetical protein